MNIQARILKFVTYTNWILFIITSLIGIFFFSLGFAKGIIFGGLIVTINFHLLYMSLKKSLVQHKVTKFNGILAKYYIRFIISGIFIFILIAKHYVNPLGLFIGLSIVVLSIMLATIYECKKLIFKVKVVDYCEVEEKKEEKKIEKKDDISIEDLAEGKK